MTAGVGASAAARGGSSREPRWITAALVAALALPALWGAGALVSDFVWRTRLLGANPIKALEHLLGEWTLRLLLLTLLVTPLRQWTGWHRIVRHRRTLGLAAFAYAALHFLTYALLDLQLDLGEVGTDLTKRPYIVVGFVALVLLVPLAVTSTRAWMARLGRRWGVLHRLVYPATVLGVVHFGMSVKRDVTGPLVYGAALAVLLGWRGWRWRARRGAEARPA